MPRRAAQEVARAGLAFCVTYKRHASFRRLCDLVRNNLFHIAKHQGQPLAVDLTSVDTQKIYLETRFLQLQYASELELWQEAYRIIEDIFTNMQMAATTPEPAVMATYYERLAQIFWASGNLLFHAYSLDRLYSLSKLDAAARRALASRVLLASLAVPAGDRFGSQEDDTMFDASDEGNLRLANLLGFKKEVPTRSKLLQSLAARNIVADVVPEAAQLYRLLENDLSPLKLKAQVLPLFGKLDESLRKYAPALEELLVVRVLQSLGRVYKSISWERFRALCPDWPSIQLERHVMQAVKADQVQARIDHRRRLLIFTEDHMESDRMKGQLVLLSTKLAALVARIKPVDPAVKAAERNGVFEAVRVGVEAEHTEVFQRLRAIERIKQEAERRQIETSQMQMARQKAEAEKRLLAERERLAQESRKRESERLRKLQEEEELSSKKKLAEDIEKKLQAALSAAKYDKAAKKIQQLTANVEAVDKEALIKAQNEVLIQEKQDRERQQKEKVRRLDYMARAVAIEEKPLLAEALEKQRREDSERYKEQYQKFLETQKALHAKNVADKQRLSRMVQQKQGFQENVLAQRRQRYEEAKAAQNDRIAKRREEMRREAERRRAEEEEERKEASARCRPPACLPACPRWRSLG